MAITLYQNYDAPIVAIAGNHDGDTRTRTVDTPDGESTLYGFVQNFCSPTAEFLFKHRAMMTQPYVYWTLDARWQRSLGSTRMSMVSSTPKALSSSNTGSHSSSRLRPPSLLVAVHHAPYSLDTSHGGYGDVGTALDRAFNTTGRTPDHVLSGHVHNYQRFMH
jgi:DNA repair exonuclease SbcCD nuclease subunit